MVELLPLICGMQTDWNLNVYAGRVGMNCRAGGNDSRDGAASHLEQVLWQERISTRDQRWQPGV